MRRLSVKHNIEINDGVPSIPLEQDEVVIVIKESEIVFAVDALRARASDVSQIAVRAHTVEGEDVHSERVDKLSWLEQGYSELAQGLVFASSHSWKSSDGRNPEREAYEIAEKRRNAFRIEAASSEVSETIS